MLFTLTWPSCGAPCNKDFDKNTLGEKWPCRRAVGDFLETGFVEVMDSMDFYHGMKNHHFSPPAFGKNMFGTCFLPHPTYAKPNLGGGPRVNDVFPPVGHPKIAVKSKGVSPKNLLKRIWLRNWNERILPRSF